MEHKGIMRRLDSLGRVVIPKEYRKLRRMEIGDLLEISALENGDIVVRKVDFFSQLRTVGAMAMASLSGKTSGTVCVCSHEKWAGFESNTGLYEGEALNKDAAAAVAERKVVTIPSAKAGITKGKPTATFFPILGDIETFGALVLLTDSEPSENEKQLLEVTASFASKNLEKY